MAALPIPRIFWPLTLTASNNALKFKATPNAGVLTTFEGTIAAGTYVTPEALATAIATGINASTPSGGGMDWVGQGGGASVSVSAAGYITIVINGQADPAGDSTLLWDDTAALQATAAVLGFNAADLDAATTSAAATFTAQNQMQNLWTPDVPVRSDSEVEKTATRTLSRNAVGQNKTTTWATLEDRTVVFEWLDPERTKTASETSSTTNQALQRFWESAGVGKFRYSPDRASPATDALDYFLLDETLGEFKPERFSEGLEVYAFTLRFGRYVS
jgi:hypothetical protein